MSFTIALAGKGGTGKTTVAGMLIKYLTSKKMVPVLAVDADPNANLNEVLGLDVAETLGKAREDMKKGVPRGMTRDVFMSMKIEQIILEASGYDLIVMGQPEGKGCYCAANSILTVVLERLTDSYPYVVIDNEAGMEHISRLTTKNVDILLIVTDTSRRGIQAAIRINKLAQDLNIGVVKSFVLVNQVKETLPDEVLNIFENAEIKFAGIIPEDETVYQYDLKGIPTIEMPDENNAVKAAFNIFNEIIKTG